ncbi:MAG: hypothetical protein DMF60_17405 [Acidobacteria bacterium]|nr:MAG: hypothetical protein DMF60_17405 [Acidobacteriota bacterium]
MNLFAEVMPFLSAAGLALFVGALLTEAMVLVPMWRTLQPQEFFTLHAAHAHRLYTFFAPLTVSATLLAVGAAITSVATDRPLRSASVVAAVLALVIPSTYVLWHRTWEVAWSISCPSSTQNRISSAAIGIPNCGCSARTSNCRLTLPSRGRPTSGFASCRPPLMSNVRPRERHLAPPPS